MQTGMKDYLKGPSEYFRFLEDEVEPLADNELLIHACSGGGVHLYAEFKFYLKENNKLVPLDEEFLFFSGIKRFILGSLEQREGRHRRVRSRPLEISPPSQIGLLRPKSNHVPHIQDFFAFQSRNLSLFPPGDSSRPSCSSSSTSSSRACLSCHSVSNHFLITEPLIDGRYLFLHSLGLKSALL